MFACFDRFGDWLLRLIGREACWLCGGWRRHAVMDAHFCADCVGRVREWAARSGRFMTEERPLTCDNCFRSLNEHCTVHLIPCCPGKCPGAARRYSFGEQ